MFIPTLIPPGRHCLSNTHSMRRVNSIISEAASCDAAASFATCWYGTTSMWPLVYG